MRGDHSACDHSQPDARSNPHAQIVDGRILRNAREIRLDGGVRAKRGDTGPPDPVSIRIGVLRPHGLSGAQHLLDHLVGGIILRERGAQRQSLHGALHAHLSGHGLAVEDHHDIARPIQHEGAHATHIGYCL